MAQDSPADQVNHPPHYLRHPSGIECIEVVQHMNFCRGNVVKYVWRAGHKDPQLELQDLQKAAWYLAREIERVRALVGGKEWTPPEDRATSDAISSAFESLASELPMRDRPL